MLCDNKTIYCHCSIIGLAEIRAKQIKKQYEERLRLARERGEKIEEPSESSSSEEEEEEEEDENGNENDGNMDKKEDVEDGNPPPLEEIETIQEVIYHFKYNTV